ncbi:MAG: succinate dehydrogenase/fumarate reductase iron-sulfur subunit [Candidatus Omnitrophica bacterium]|nr:succinate dehydrogenase/fumarate reductase iron-sulfur subunit [Candidatus Omnitrophota bacterium]
MDLKLKVWRQKDSASKGKFEIYNAPNINPHMSFLEMLDVINEDLIHANQDPIAFDHDCREGICGACSLTVDGKPHGPEKGTTACQLHMRHFKHGNTITVEPWRAKAFPVIKDLIVDRSAFDRIIESGGYVSVNTGSAPEANMSPVPKHAADSAMDSAACIGCGACVAACPNASGMLFVAAKVSQLALLPQGQVEREKRVLSMVRTMDDENFGNCTNHYECEAACPKEISVGFIAKMNREYLRASLCDSGSAGNTKDAVN